MTLEMKRSIEIKQHLEGIHNCSLSDGIKRNNKLWISEESLITFLDKRIDHYTPYREILNTPEMKNIVAELQLIKHELEGRTKE